jgi:hypothetical protein
MFRARPTVSLNRGWLPVLPTSTPPPARVSDDTERELKQATAGGMPIEELRERIARSRPD